MILKNTVSWDVRPYSLADIYRNFGGTFYVQIHIYSESEVELSSETSVNLYWITSRPIRKGNILKKSFGHLLRLRDYSKDFSKIW